MTYLEKADAALEKALEHASRMSVPGEAAEMHLNIARQYGVLAAIDKGLIPRDPDNATARQHEVSGWPR